MINAFIRLCRRRLRQESGVVIVLVAIMLTVILGAAALAIDVGSFYQAQRQAQAAADAGALAAVQNLPGSTSAASNAGSTYATTNYPGSVATVQTGYNGNNNQVKVTVNATAPAFFGRFLGLTSAKVSASAVAGTTNESAPVAIYANDSNGSDPSCTGGITLNGNNETIGGLESNGAVNLSGNNDSDQAVMYGVNGTNSCRFNPNGNNMSNAAIIQNQAPAPFPVDYGANLPPCNPPISQTPPNLSWIGNGGGSAAIRIPAGVYCAVGTGDPNNPSTWNGTITISKENLLTTNVTFIGGSFSFSGNSGGPLTPYDPSNPILIYQTGSSPLTIDGNEFLAGGAIEAKNANCTINGNSNNGTTILTYSGIVECNNVSVSGNNFSFAGIGPVIGGGGGGLVQ